ncbi:NADH-dependent [FeFe] hydrogenase, group A6 [Mesoterricola sediminis]|uniref:Ferredoxin n=1 Tax=Mesoterricola sediminis TaxID=2927980 RepID=A0AA48KBP7_9BACT|nr:NADH-dependent [FeFe] hydrogenase, group A6 [Mesoterricola sediminis]BDU76339.1 ferredoxin [Mesoterricola sediminis]
MTETMITLTIDSETVQVPKGTTVLKAAEKLGIHIPRLCYHPKLSLEGSCRICVVQVEGFSSFLTACSHEVWEGMKVQTNSPEIRQARRDIVELLLDNHPMDCQTCDRDGICELQKQAYRLGVRERLFEGKRKRFPIDDASESVVRTPEKCILCGRCIRVCKEVQGVHNLSQHGRGFETVVGPANLGKMDDSACIQCGQCINVCPTAAFLEKDHTERVWQALALPRDVKHIVVQPAPSIRAAIGECFGMPIGTPVTGKLITALRRLGFDAVFDTNFGADLTIIEEANEFLRRMSGEGPLPLLTSCSPGWVSFLEKFYPEMIPFTSTCKSPMSMLSTLSKTHYAEKKGLRPDQVYMVAIMPCVAKKFEAARPEHAMEDGTPYTDAVLTTRELAWMIKSYGIDFQNLPDGEFDRPLGISSGAADIFGATGGVMEAALRTAAVKLTGDELGPLVFEDVRGVTGIKEATLTLDGKEINIAVSNGLTNAKTLLEAVKSGGKQYHLIEIMACPGGCVAGGGQPYPPFDMDVLDPQLPKLRAKALYQIDHDKQLRRSHENPAIEHLYQEFLGEPNGEKAHALLHTHYHARMPRGIK